MRSLPGSSTITDGDWQTPLALWTIRRLGPRQPRGGSFPSPHVSTKERIWNLALSPALPPASDHLPATRDQG